MKQYFPFKHLDDIITFCEIISKGGRTETLRESSDWLHHDYTEEELTLLPNISSLMTQFRTTHNEDILAQMVVTIIPVHATYKGSQTTSVHVYDWMLGYYTQNMDLLMDVAESLAPDYMNNTNRQVSLTYKIRRLLSRKRHLTVELDETFDSAEWIRAENCLVHTIIKDVKNYSPQYFLTSKTKTKYDPSIQDNTLLNMVWSFVNENPERFVLAKQILLTSLIGVRLGDSLIWILGRGGTGKSVFTRLITALIGGSVHPSKTEGLVSDIPFSEFTNHNQLSTLLNAQVQIGDDMNDRSILKETLTLKSLSSGSSVSLNRKYDREMTSLSFSGPLIQNAPTLPRFIEASGQITRRSVVLKAEHRFADSSTKLSNKEVATLFENDYYRSGLLNSLLEESTSLLADGDYNPVDSNEVKELEILNNPNEAFREEIRQLDLPSGTQLPNELLRAIYSDVVGHHHTISKRSFYLLILRECEELGMLKINNSRGKRFDLNGLSSILDKLDGKHVMAFHQLLMENALMNKKQLFPFVTIS